MDVLTWFGGFADRHWFLAIVLIMAVAGTVRLPFLLVNRLLRSINVALRGWPPAHIDSDGDWRPK